MGWVRLFLILHLHKLCVREVVCEPQLWEWGRVGVPQGGSTWEPDRKAKSLAFLGKDEDKVIEQNNNSVDSEEPEKTTKAPKKAKLNVSDKDSPYALIDKYFPERESYFYQNKNKFVSEYNAQGRGKKTDIGNIDPSEVWLADDNLLVLKGGSTSDRDGYDNPWEPIDDFQAPYREPVLPPPDFDPDSLDIGVGVPIETLIEERSKAKKKTKVPDFSNFDVITKEELSSAYNPTVPGLEEIPPLINPDNALQPYKDEVIRSQDEFKKFFNDVSQFINDMENFHPARQSAPHPGTKEEIDRNGTPRFSKTTPKPSVPSTTEAQRYVKTTRAVRQQNTPQLEKDFPSPASWQSAPNQRQISQGVTWSPAPINKDLPTSYPLSYSSPYSKVFLSTSYIQHQPSTTTPQPVKLSITPKYSPQTRSQQARSTRRPIITTPTPIRSYTFAPVYKERSTTPRYSTTRPTTVKSTTIRTITPKPNYYSQFSRTNLSNRVIYNNPEYQDTQDWLPVTTQAPSRLSRKQASKPPITYNSPDYYNPSPTPYSLFQSVPENIGETGVFHLSQNVDFGKKIETDNPVLNEVDNGYRGPVSVHKLVSTRPPRKVAKARGALDGLIPTLFSHKRDETRSRKSRGRSTVRRRRPKHVQPAADRQGNGDVRYVSFYSGGTGGNSWGYSYKLGK